jgi:hypothetical protein
VTNLRDFVREKKPGQRVDIANNLNLLNLHEGVPMVELAWELNIDHGQFTATHDAGANLEDALRPLLVGPDNFHRFVEAQRQLTRRATQLGFRIFFHRPLALGFAPRADAAPAHQGRRELTVTQVR